MTCRASIRRGLVMWPAWRVRGGEGLIKLLRTVSGNGRMICVAHLQKEYVAIGIASSFVKPTVRITVFLQVGAYLASL